MSIDPPKIFISHAHENKSLVRRLEQELKAAGAEVWVDHSEVRAGNNFSKQISEALERCNVLLLIWSEAAAQSHWVEQEWTNAFALQKEIVPCRLDQKALPALLANRLYVDFGDIERGLAELLRAFDLAQKQETSSPKDHVTEVAHVFRRALKGTLPPIWNVPHHRNPNFTGREELLQNLRTALTSEQSAALTQAIHGLGGVGKTQLAVEYAYRFSHEYEAVWWLAAESPAKLAADYAALAQPLALPEKEAADQNLAIAAVRHWLNHHDRWLLVFDNAPEVEALHGYLPQAATGHVLITSRNPNWRSLAQPFAVSTFAPEEAIDFLCKRTGQTDHHAALKLAEALGHLPLALTQAAAYIEETGKSVADYLALYQQHRQKLLARAKPTVDYPYTVATTWDLSFQALQLQCATATDLLHLGAFLAPEEIPWDLLQPALSQVEQLKTSALADPLESDAAVAVLRRYSLLEVKDQSLSLHRLVQQVIQDRLPEAEHAHWQEAAVRLVAEVFPFDSDDVRTWPICRRLLAHALLLSEAEIVPDGVAFLCNQVGLYFNACANYAEAESLYRRSLAIREKQLGPEHSHVAISLNNLALLFTSQGKYVTAESLHRRSLTIREKQLGPEHPDVATSLNNLALLFQLQGKYVEAGSLFQRSLAIREKQLGPEHPDVANSLNNIAGLLESQGKYADAEPFYRRSLANLEKQLGLEHSYVTAGINNLATLLYAQGKYTEAEALFRRGLVVRENQLGPEHPDIATSLNNLAALLGSQGKYNEAELLNRRSVAIYEKQLGLEHPNVATSLNNLAESLEAQSKYAEAEPLFRRSLAIRENQLGPEHPDVAISLNNLAGLLESQGKYSEAEPLLRRALAIFEKQLGTEHPNVATSMGYLAELLYAQGKYTEAESLYRRCLTISEKQLGPEHPDVAASLNNLAGFLMSKGKYTEAELLYRRSLAIQEQQLGPEHPAFATSLNNLAALLKSQGKPADAEPLLRRSLAICEKTLGPEHPNTQTVRKNLTLLLEEMQGK